MSAFEDSLAELNMVEATREMRAAFRGLREALVTEDGWSQTMAEQIAAAPLIATLAALMQDGVARSMAEQMLRRMEGQ